VGWVGAYHEMRKSKGGSMTSATCFRSWLWVVFKGDGLITKRRRLHLKKVLFFKKVSLGVRAFVPSHNWKEKKCRFFIYFFRFAICRLLMWVLLMSFAPYHAAVRHQCFPNRIGKQKSA
jgi:hypothetical protein